MSSAKLNFKKIVNRLILFIGIGVSAHIIFVLSTTEKSMLLNLEKLSFWHIALIFILIIFPWFSYAARVIMWSGFLKEKISYLDALRVVITADLASALSPTAVGGAPVKAALLINRGFSPGNVGFLLTYGVIEDILFYTTGILLAGYFSTGLLGRIAGGIGAILLNYGWYIFGFTMILALYLVLLKYNKIPVGFRFRSYLPIRWKSRLNQLRVNITNSFHEMKSNFDMAVRHGKIKMLISMLMLYLQWMSKFSVLLVILHAFQIDFETIQIYIRQWVVYVTMLFIPTPGASGGAEASFLLIFGKSIPPDISFLVVSLWRLFTYYFILLSAVLFYLLLSILLRKEEELIIETTE